MDTMNKRVPLTPAQANRIAEALMAAEPRLADRLPKPSHADDAEEWPRRPIGTLGTLRPSWRSLP